MTVFMSNAAIDVRNLIIITLNARLVTLFVDIVWISMKVPTVPTTPHLASNQNVQTVQITSLSQMITLLLTQIATLTNLSKINFEKSSHTIIKKLNKLHQESTNSTVVHPICWNVRSINNKVDNIMSLAIDRNMSILFLTETWLSSPKK